MAISKRYALLPAPSETRTARPGRTAIDMRRRYCSALGALRNPLAGRRSSMTGFDEAAPLAAPVEVESGAIPLPPTVPRPAPPRAPRTPSFDDRLALAGDRAAAYLDAEIEREARRRRRREDEELLLFQ